MSRMEEAFKEMKKENKKILVSYFPLGDPCVADSAEWAKLFYDCGTTVLEVGLPFEKPVLDGTVVRESMERALQRINLDESFEEIRKIRNANPKKIIQLMTYVENILKIGFEEFAEKCHECDIDAVLSANANQKQMAELDRVLSRYDIDNLRFIPYHIEERHVEDLKNNGKGYVYLQAIDGKTGGVTELTDQIEKNIDMLRSAGIEIPLIPGFGISTQEHIRVYLSMGADGVIVGSSIIKNLLEGNGETYIRSLAQALE